ncbi:MAG: glycoside hydrolase family 99-like domain-containing protein [Candidatus Aureabacteria bacterium]|nr:glycoside hydrolase family 99-like domain-containing protein [Candidatus Auribacterota bacterium]
MKRISTWIIWIVCLGLAWSIFSPSKHSVHLPSQTNRYLIGAYYYLWYPKNFTKYGYLRKMLDPPQTPLLGVYDSSKIEVAEQHIAWCSQYGIDFLALNWWPTRPEQNRCIEDSFLKAKNIKDIRFCIFYEAWNLNWDPKTATTVFTDQTIEKLIRDFSDMADSYFYHPSYLRIQGRPVVILYLTRTFTGRYHQAIARLRSEINKKGWNLFLIGDEVFWDAISERIFRPPCLSVKPQSNRVRLFDAVTAYNMYEHGKKEYAGYGSQTRFLKDVAEKYREYFSLFRNKVGFVPNVIPGYNDRGVRRVSDHFVIPRQYDLGGKEASFLLENIVQTVLPYVDPRLNMVLITSWNEWNEDTAIEPLLLSGTTSKDQSPSGTLFTQGFSYSGHGTVYLEMVRDQFVAVYGRVMDIHGQPVPGISVVAFKNRRIMARDRSDSNGYYRLSRLHLHEGNYRVCPERYPKKDKQVVIVPEKAVCQDFTLDYQSILLRDASLVSG